MRDGAIRPWLERALREALRARDTVTVSAVRSALAALDNAQAVPAGTFMKLEAFPGALRRA